jgi:hypothetical protein
LTMGMRRLLSSCMLAVSAVMTVAHTAGSVLWTKANANFELQTAGATAHVLAIRLLQ